MNRLQIQKIIHEELKRIRVENANAAFAGMTPSQQRVTIAQDVLRQLAAKRIRATSGAWLEDVRYDAFVPTADADAELCDIVKKMPECRACALGGLFMCALDRADDFKVGKLKRYEEATEQGNDVVRVNVEDVFGYLTRFFPKRTLAMAEAAFEMGHGYIRPASVNLEDYGLTRKEWETAEKFGRDTNAGAYVRGVPSGVERAAARLAAVMRNIVRNNGEFMPEQGVVNDDLAPVEPPID